MLEVQEPILRTAGAHLRPLNPARDLLPVADLIELCFAQTMDPDGHDYLQHMRQAARDENYLRWVPLFPEGMPLGMGGFVWEENGAIIGNLSLIPMTKASKRIYLIANVATHPDHRRRGIGRALTQAAVDYARNQGSPSTCLQVRQENLPALALYQSLGFVERARRTSWINEGHTPGKPYRSGFTVTPRRAEDWLIQAAWLRDLYPREVIWNLPIHPNRFKPGFMNSISRFLLNEQIEQWAARRDSQLIGVVSWEPSHSYADSLWLASSSELEDLAVQILLPGIRQLIPTHRPLSLNYPANRAVNAIQEAGFTESQTLIWMERVEPAR